MPCPAFVAVFFQRNLQFTERQIITDDSVINWESNRLENCYFIITSSSVIQNSSKIAWSTKLQVTFQNTNQSPNTEIGGQTTSAHELQLIDSHLPVSTTFVTEHGACFWSWASDSAWRDWLWQGKGFKNFFGDTDALKISRKPSLTPQNLKGPLKKACYKNLKPSYN